MAYTIAQSVSSTQRIKLPMSHGVKSLHRIQNAKSLQHTASQITLQHSEMSHSTAECNLYSTVPNHCTAQCLATPHHTPSFRSLYSTSNMITHSTAVSSYSTAYIMHLVTLQHRVWVTLQHTQRIYTTVMCYVTLQHTQCTYSTAVC